MVTETLVVNFFAGPGIGKSTLAAELFAYLKYSGLECELVGEAAKDLVWEKSFHRLEYQIGLFAEQHRRIHRLLGQVDVVICDSPLLLSLVYGVNESDEFRAFVLSEHNKLNNLNYFLLRDSSVDAYAVRENQTGRQQGSRDKAITLDREIHSMFLANQIDYLEIYVKPAITINFLRKHINARRGKST